MPSVDFKEQYDKIYRYCYLHIHNRETAEDLTQETFLRFIERPQYNNGGKELQYLYTIARNLCIDEYRKKRVTEPLDNEIIEQTNNENDWLTHIALHNAIKSLSDEDREIILLRFINEVPMSVISELYNISRFSLYRRINKILAALRKEFGKDEKDESKIQKSTEKSL